MNTPTFVIAGCYHEYFAFLNVKGLPRNTEEYVFFSDPTHLLSLSNSTILCVGDYRKSPVLGFAGLEMLKWKNVIRFVNTAGDEV